MPPLEKELKYSLTEAGYRRLMRALAPCIGKRTRTRTYYFDDSAFSLRRAGMGLRVRVASGREAVLTLKLPAQRTRGPRGYRVREEHEKKIPLGRARRVIEGKTSVSSLAVQPIRLLRKRVGEETLVGLRSMGGISMVRAKAPLGDFILEIDRFRIFGKAFHEVEIETDRPHEAQRLSRALFARLRIQAKPSVTTKLGRFFREWEKKKGRGKG